MSRLRKLVTLPFRLVIDPVERLVKGKLAGLIDAQLEPVRRDLKVLDTKLDQILDIHVAPEILNDFRAHNLTLRAIQADCDLIRELNPLFQGFLRDLTRLQLGCEEIAQRLDRLETPAHQQERDFTRP